MAAPLVAAGRLVCERVDAQLRKSPLGASLVDALVTVLVTARALVIFAYACFLRPIGKGNGSQQARLDSVRPRATHVRRAR
jgi:hypothetical protein